MLPHGQPKINKLPSLPNHKACIVTHNKHEKKPINIGKKHQTIKIKP